MTHPKLTPDRLGREAIVYPRQSTPSQVLHHQESQRRQYGLAQRGRELGFQRITVIDEDLGRTGSGLVDRPGFQRLVAHVCSGEVGAVLCLEASRLARLGAVEWTWRIQKDLAQLEPDGSKDRTGRLRIAAGIVRTQAARLHREEIKEAYLSHPERAELLRQTERGS